MQTVSQSRSQVDTLLEKCLDKRPQDIISLIGRLIPKEEANTQKQFAPIIVNAGDGTSVSIGGGGEGQGDEGQDSPQIASDCPRIDDSVNGRVLTPSTDNGQQNATERIGGNGHSK